MRTLILFFTVLFSFQLGYTQRNVFDGYIIKSNGKKVEGVIQIPQHKYPWEWQEKIYFHKGITTAKEKIKKNKGEKFSPKDIDGYGLNDGREFRTIKYNNLDALSQGNNLNGLNSASNALSNLKSSRFFAEVVHLSEKTKVYKFYSKPPGFTVSSGEETAELADIRRNANIFYDVLIWKAGNKKAKSFDSASIKKLFEDCPLVVEKFQNMEYKKKPLKGLKTAINNAQLEGSKKEEACMEMVNDYNAKCG